MYGGPECGVGAGPGRVLQIRSARSSGARRIEEQRASIVCNAGPAVGTCGIGSAGNFLRHSARHALQDLAAAAIDIAPRPEDDFAALLILEDRRGLVQKRTVERGNEVGGLPASGRARGDIDVTLVGCIAAQGNTAGVALRSWDRRRRRAC